ncbi:hypothetical protein CEXT_136751, partial [Caerostris extrusa]
MSEAVSASRIELGVCTGSQSFLPAFIGVLINTLLVIAEIVIDIFKNSG